MGKIVIDASDLEGVATRYKLESEKTNNLITELRKKVNSVELNTADDAKIRVAGIEARTTSVINRLESVRDELAREERLLRDRAAKAREADKPSKLSRVGSAIANAPGIKQVGQGLSWAKGKVFGGGGEDDELLARQQYEFELVDANLYAMQLKGL